MNKQKVFHSPFSSNSKKNNSTKATSRNQSPNSQSRKEIIQDSKSSTNKPTITKKERNNDLISKSLSSNTFNNKQVIIKDSDKSPPNQQKTHIEPLSNQKTKQTFSEPQLKKIITKDFNNDLENSIDFINWRFTGIDQQITLEKVEFILKFFTIINQNVQEKPQISRFILPMCQIQNKSDEKVYDTGKLKQILIDSFNKTDKDPFWREMAYCIQSSRMNEKYKFYFESEEKQQTLVYQKMNASSSPIFQKSNTNKKFDSQDDIYMNNIMNEQKQRKLLLSPVHHNENSSDSITDEEIQPKKRQFHKKQNRIDEILVNCGISSIEDLQPILISLRYKVSVNEKQITEMRNTISSITKENTELSESYTKEKETTSELQEQLNNMTKQFEIEKEQKKQIKKDNEDIEKEINELKALFDLVNVQNAKQSIQKLQNQFYKSNDNEYESKTQNKSYETLQKQNEKSPTNKNVLISRMKIQIQEQANIIDAMNSLIDETLTMNKLKISEMQRVNDELMQNYAKEKETTYDLQKHYTEMKHNLEESEQRLENMGNKYKDLFEMKNNNQELTDENNALMNELNETINKNSHLEETVESMTIQLHEYEDRLYRLENQNTEYSEKISPIDKMLSQIKEIVDFEDPESLVQVVTDLKKENDEARISLINTEKQLEEIFQALPDFILTKKVTVPLSRKMLKEIIEFFDEIQADSQSYRADISLILRMAKENGYNGEEVGGALETISYILREGYKNKEELLKVQEKLKILESNTDQQIQYDKAENEVQLKQLQSQLDSAQNKVEKLLQVKDNLIKIKAEEKPIDED